MTNESENDLERIDWWINFLKEGLEKHVSKGLDVNPDTEVTSLKESYFINKVATICVSMEILKKRIEELEKKSA